MMLLFVYRSLVTMILVLVTVLVELAAARGIVSFLANSGIHRTVDVLDQSAHAAGHRRRHRLRDIHRRPLSRRAQRRAGAGNRLLQHVSRDRPRDLGIGADDRRRGVLPELHPDAVFSEPGRSRRDRRPGWPDGLAHPGARGADHRQPLRAVRAQAQNADSGMAADRHRYRPLARAHSGRDDRGGRWSVCWRCPATRPVTTTLPTCLPAPRPTSVTRPPNAISRRPGSIPNC